MNSIKRLEEIKNSCLEGLHKLFGEPWVSMPKENFDWLIQQAEKREYWMKQHRKRANELEDAYFKIQLIEKQLQQAQVKAERYKHALEFYADKETYETKFATDTDEIYDPFTLIELDEGKKARQALGGEK